MYCVKGNSSWYISCRPLFGGCPLLGVSVIGGSTVCPTESWWIWNVIMLNSAPIMMHCIEDKK